jgi:hypothetical protein
MEDANMTELKHDVGLFVSKDSARALCMSAGDWSALAALEIDRLLTKAQNRRPEAFEQGLQDLVTRGAITANDAGLLQQVIKCAFAAAREKAELAACRAEVLDCYSRLCAEPQASPAALAITSTALRVLEQSPANPIPATPGISAHAASTGAKVGFGIGGALIGAGIGAGFGPIGAGVGAVIGGAVGVGIEISNEKGV